jgi:hypothetical protein
MKYGDQVVTTKYGVFIFTRHSIERIIERGIVDKIDYKFFDIFVDDFEVGKAKHKIKDPGRFWLRHAQFGFVLYVTFNEGACVVLSAYPVNKGKEKLFKSIKWIKVKNFYKTAA